MRFKKLGSLAVSLLISVSILGGANKSVHAQEITTSKSIKRIEGLNRYKTSRAIAEELGNDILENVVIASGYQFADGLSGSILAKKLNAPLLLAGSLEHSKEALDYISKHLKSEGNIYILGGEGVVSKDTEQALKDKGYNVKRIFGKDRIETNSLILDNLQVEEGTPVFISNAFGYADVLSASAISALKEYPILLTRDNALPDLIKEQILKIKPSKVYIVGGTGVVKPNVFDEIKSLVPTAEIDRLGGINRYETSMIIFREFNLDTKNLILASGKDFPDALSGSQLAVNLNASMVLSDENNLDTQQEEFNEKGIENFYLLGGKGSLSPTVEYAINFDKVKELEAIKVVFGDLSKAVENKNVDEYMKNIDRNSPYYALSRELMKNAFITLDQSDLNLISSFEGYEVLKLDYTEANIKVVENDVIIHKQTQDKTIKSFTIYCLFKKVDGEWKLYSNLIVEK